MGVETLWKNGSLQYAGWSYCGLAWLDSHTISQGLGCKQKEQYYLYIKNKRWTSIGLMPISEKDNREGPLHLTCNWLYKPIKLFIVYSYNLDTCFSFALFYEIKKNKQVSISQQTKDVQLCTHTQQHWWLWYD